MPRLTIIVRLLDAVRQDAEDSPSSVRRFSGTKEATDMEISRKVAGMLSITSERGVTAIEYGLIASLIAIGIIVGVTLVGTNLNSLFSFIGGKVVPPT